MLIEAVRMVERGDSTVADIDEAMRLGAKHPVGPLALVDMVGLDIIKDILDGNVLQNKILPIVLSCIIEKLVLT